MAICYVMLPDYQLIGAIESGCTADFNDAVERGATIAARDLKGRCVLEVAMRHGLLDIGRRLIRMGASPDVAIGNYGDRLIHLAAKTGDMGFLQLFLEAGVDANSRGNCQRTPLHYVAKGGHQFIAALLLDHYANVDATDDRGNTPLHFAGTQGNLPMTRMFLRHHARATLTNNQLYTPIHNAAAEGHTEAVVLMFSHEQSLNPRFSTSDMVRRVRRVAELHGKTDTVKAIAVAEAEMQSLAVNLDSSPS